MTCQEFRKVNEVLVFEMTRATRAACGSHFMTCSTCREWITHSAMAEMARISPPPELVAKVRLEASQLIAEDLQDPEFREEVERA